MTPTMPLNKRVEAGDAWGVQQLEGALHKPAVLVACPFWPPDGAAALDITASLLPGRKEGDLQKGLLFLSL